MCASRQHSRGEREEGFPALSQPRSSYRFVDQDSIGMGIVQLGQTLDNQSNKRDIGS